MQYCLKTDGDPKVKGHALIVLAQLESESAIDTIKQYMNSEENDIQLGAITALIKYCGSEGAFIASEKLRALAHSPIPSERILAAKSVAYISSEEFDGVLITQQRNKSCFMRCN